MDFSVMFHHLLINMDFKLQHQALISLEVIPIWWNGRIASKIKIRP